MSLNLVSRMALALGALTISALPAFADTTPARVVPSPTHHAVAHVQKAELTKPAKKSHVKKAALHHHTKSMKAGVEKTRLTTKSPTTKASHPVNAEVKS